MPVFILMLILPIQSLGFLSFLGDQAKKGVEVAAYASSAAELVSELVPSPELKEGAKNIERRSENIRSKASEIRYLSRTSQNILKGPEWSSRRLDSNIHSTTDYVRRLKRLLVKVAALGTDGATALNTTEINVNLVEVQKNQQAMLLNQEDEKLRYLEKEQEEALEWDQFSKRQRRIRSKEEASGKLH